MTRPRPVLERLLRRVTKTETCWIWMGAKIHNGYGVMHVATGSKLVHRIAYEHLVGPIPDGLTIDHLCRNRLCVNPAHLETVSQKENVRRGAIAALRVPKTHCPQGHPYDERNTYWTTTPNGTRSPACRICTRASGARYRRRLRVAKQLEAETA